ncbi:MAG: DNA-deoxyinosine glycosylase [Spirochaetota bacterium]
MQIQSFSPVVDEDSILLVLGTMPGEESIRKQEYYGNPKNLFWDIVYRILQPKWDFFATVHDTEPYHKRLQLLQENKIALSDNLQYCDRIGSLDKNIRNHVKNDFASFFHKYQNIRRVVCNGELAYKYFKESNQTICGVRNIVITKVPSTSSANASNSFAKLRDWKKEILPALASGEK